MNLFDIGITDFVTDWNNAPFWSFTLGLIALALHFIGQRFNCFGWGRC